MMKATQKLSVRLRRPVMGESEPASIRRDGDMTVNAVQPPGHDLARRGASLAGLSDPEDVLMRKVATTAGIVVRALRSSI